MSENTNLGVTLKNNTFEENTFRNFALNEFKVLGWLDENGKFIDGLQERVCGDILEILEVFSKQGHSGSTADYCINILQKLLRFQPLCPLTGEPSEWVEFKDQTILQNKRCSTVFKDKEYFNGMPYDINGYVYIDENGESFTNVYSTKLVTFPYSPKTEYVKYGSTKYQEMEFKRNNNLNIHQKA